MPAATTSVQLSWTNKADWVVQVQANDADTGRAQQRAEDRAGVIFYQTVSFTHAAQAEPAA